ncbi:MAG: SDR family oxidoreductase [Planctomycetaceae bacterium]|nr:SDR family oxidoreductase [Planctomycetaceae bacterium]
MKKLILGCGYLGRRVAQAWLDGGDEVLALTRSAERAASLQAAGIRPIVGDVTSSLDLRDCDDLDTILFAVGFDRTAGKAIRDVYVDGLRRAIDQLPMLPRRFIYISSTGVFAQNDGKWVNEQSLCEPTREGGKACLAAEDLLRQHAMGSHAIILRLAGIYGPDRLPKLRDVIAGKPITASAHGYLNLIHIDDAVRVVLAAGAQLSPPELLLVSDGAPVLRGDFYRELARASNSPPPRFEEPLTDSSTAFRASTDKRIDSSRLRERLRFEYRYPSYVEGVASILARND